MGDERTLGTHAWHLTLPVSAGLQWSVKLAIALAASFIGIALPVALARITFGHAFDSAPGPKYDFLFVAAFAMTSAAFWCACVVRGTVRAVMLVFPAMATVAIAIPAGLTFVSTPPMTQALDDLILRWHPFPFATATLLGVLNVVRFFGDWLFVPPLILALIQTRRLFRQEVPDGILFAARYLLPLMLTAFLVALAWRIPDIVFSVASDHMYRTMYETHATVGKLPKIAELRTGEARPLTIEELSKVAPLSNATQILLRGSSVTVRPKEGDPDWLKSHNKHSEYFTTIRFRNNWECTAYGGPYFHCKTPQGWFGTPTHP